MRLALCPHPGAGSSRCNREKRTMRTWMCLICGWLYDEAAGLPDEGIAPGTRWEDVPPNWVCSECGARKEHSEPIGRETGRYRVCQYVWMSVVTVSLKKKKTYTKKIMRGH